MHRIPTPPGVLFVLLMGGALCAPAAVAASAAGGPAKGAGVSAVTVVTPSGVRYVDLRLGQGEEAQPGRIMEVHYVGWLADGTKFDSSRDRDRPFTFRLGEGDMIKGWDEGLLGMRVGGKRRLTVPPELGFGRQGLGGVVPPNAVLHYEIELLAVR